MTLLDCSKVTRSQIDHTTNTAGEKRDAVFFSKKMRSFAARGYAHG